jgi:hypothetical protein
MRQKIQFDEWKIKYFELACEVNKALVFVGDQRGSWLKVTFMCDGM